MSTVRTATDKQIFLNLPSTASDVQAPAPADQASGADTVVISGRYNRFIPDIETTSLHSVSTAFCSTELTVPVVGSNGARNAEDVIRFRASGASAVEFVTAVWRQGPRVITTILEGIDAYLAKHGVTDTQELVGRSALKSRSYAEIEPLPHRPTPWQHGSD